MEWAVTQNHLQARGVRPVPAYVPPPHNLGLAVTLMAPSH